MKYFIASLEHTRKEDLYITFLRTDGAPTWIMSLAAVLPEEDVMEALSRYNDGKYNIAVNEDAIRKSVSVPRRFTTQNPNDPVIFNNASNWARLLKGVIAAPAVAPEPDYKWKRT